MKTFPDVTALSRSSDQKVLRTWEGLGYYTRARNILAAARIIRDSHGGQLPRSYSELIALPGIGPYTASAILSIAFGEPYPVVDANVRRIGQRLMAWTDWNRKREQHLALWLADNMPSEKPGPFNESLMGLGQTICIRRNPQCPACPLSPICEAYRRGIELQIPKPTHRITVEKETLLLRWPKGVTLLP